MKVRLYVDIQLLGTWIPEAGKPGRALQKRGASRPNATNNLKQDSGGTPEGDPGGDAGRDIRSDSGGTPEVLRRETPEGVRNL